MLSSEQIQVFRDTGHLTVPNVFSSQQMFAATRDLDAWSDEFLSQLAPDQEAWFLEQGVEQGPRSLRKLDNPVFLRPVFRALANDARLVACVTQLIGGPLRVWFSQVFLKPAACGGAKPVHQDNFYFGPNDPDGVLTAWIAIDDATPDNGCLCFADGSNRGSVLPHMAPKTEPFNLQVEPQLAAAYEMTPASVPRGGVSFHHGNTLHSSAPNRSNQPRRAVAIHFVNAQTDFENPALAYDESVIVEIGQNGTNG